MNSDRKVDYYVGLDMGTGALGCAVTDTQYRLIKVKGKDFWFVCLNTSNHSFSPFPCQTFNICLYY